LRHARRAEETAVLVLTRSEVASLLDMDQVIAAVERAHASLSSGSASDLGPASLAVPASSALMIPMVAAIDNGTGGVKLLMDAPDNAALSRPTQQSTIVLVDTTTGSCDAFLDGASITRVRTAAASAVATRYLAREGPAVLGFIGAGALARTHLQAMRSVRPIRHVLVWSRTPSTGKAFAEHVADEGLDAQVADSPEEVVSASDILCTLTPSRSPVVLGRWFKPGLHINAVGAPPRSDHREIDTEGIQRSRVVVDSLQVARHKSGDVLIPLAEGAIPAVHFQDELGQIINGYRPGRTDENQITLYNSVGLAIQDIATAQLVVAAARKNRVGVEVALTF
jgi:alanine dehydrogenase